MAHGRLAAGSNPDGVEQLVRCRTGPFGRRRSFSHTAFRGYVHEATGGGGVAEAAGPDHVTQGMEHSECLSSRGMGAVGVTCRVITPPEATNTGPDLTGSPGVAPGDVSSKNGQGHIRVQRGVISYNPRPLCVCLPKVAVYIFGIPAQNGRARPAPYLSASRQGAPGRARLVPSATWRPARTVSSSSHQALFERSKTSVGATGPVAVAVDT